MATKVYGCSDDLIEFEGDVRGEVGCFRPDKDAPGVLVVFSDGTLLEVRYGKAGLAIWEAKVIARGSLFESLEVCSDEDAEIYSDVVCFKDGLKWAYAATEWQRVT